MAEELAAAEAVAGERHVHARAGLHAVLIRDCRVVAEDSRDRDLSHPRDEGQVGIQPHVVGGQRPVAAAAAEAIGGGGEDSDEEYEGKEVHRKLVEWSAIIAGGFEGRKRVCVLKGFKSRRRSELTFNTTELFFFFLSLSFFFSINCKQSILFGLSVV